MDDGGEGRGGAEAGQLAGSFAGAALLEGEWESLRLEDERDRALALHQALIALRCALAATELRLGELFAHFAPGGRFTFEPLGAASRESGCPERFGISWALARQFIDLARGLAPLPLSRDAFLLALIERSKLRWLLKVATPSTEAGWLALASRRGERQFAADVRRFQQETGASSEVRATAPDEPIEPAVEEERRWLRLTGTPAQAAAVRTWVYDAMRKVAGNDRLEPWQCLELLCADVIAGLRRDPRAARRWGEGGAGACSEARRREAARAGRQVARPAGGETARAAAGLAGRPFDDVLRALVRCVRLRQRILAERATLLCWLDGRSLWRHLGATTLVAYAGRALGMPPKDLREAIRLRARLSMLPKVRAAWLRGRLPAFTARQLANIASRENEDAWIEHLATCTGKRIDTELHWHELALHALDIAAWRRKSGGGQPQPERSMEGLRDDIERMARGSVERIDGAAPEVRAIAEDRRPLTSFGLWAPPYVAALVRTTLNEVRATGEAWETDGDAIVLLAETLLDEIAESRPELNREMRINYEAFARDGWQCANPHCRSRRNLHSHHVVFRSHDGCNERRNEVTLCASCYLRLLHQGFLVITRARPAPTQEFIFELPHVGERYREGMLLAA